MELKKLSYATLLTNERMCSLQSVLYCIAISTTIPFFSPPKFITFPNVSLPSLIYSIKELYGKKTKVYVRYSSCNEGNIIPNEIIKDLKSIQDNYFSKEPMTIIAHNASFDIASGKVLLPREARWLEDFKREVITFPNGRHDDQVDALTQLILRSAFKSAHEKYMEAIDMLIEDQKSDEAKARRYYYMNRFKKFF